MTASGRPLSTSTGSPRCTSTGHGDQHAEGLARDRELLAGNWQRHGYVAKDLLHGGADIISSVDRTLGREWDSSRLAAWQHLVKHSLYGRPGQARAYRQWRRTQP